MILQIEIFRKKAKCWVILGNNLKLRELKLTLKILMLILTLQIEGKKLMINNFCQCLMIWKD